SGCDGRRGDHARADEPPAAAARRAGSEAGRPADAAAGRPQATRLAPTGSCARLPVDSKVDPEGSMRLSLNPPTVVATAALFFAAGGSALAVTQATRPQARCANGAVRGVAVVTGNPSQGIANIPDTFSSNRSLFSRAFNCTGAAVQVRRIDRGVYEV